MGLRTDMAELLPGSMKVADMRLDEVGTRLFHCHVKTASPPAGSPLPSHVMSQDQYVPPPDVTETRARVAPVGHNEGMQPKVVKLSESQRADAITQWVRSRGTFRLSDGQLAKLLSAPAPVWRLRAR